jgi:hypothetical protein
MTPNADSVRLICGAQFYNVKPSFEVTYRRADGAEVGGEYGWVTTLESCESEVEYADAPLEFIKETWQRVGVESVWLEPATVSCEAAGCDEDSERWVQLDGKWQQFCREHLP